MESLDVKDTPIPFFSRRERFSTTSRTSNQVYSPISYFRSTIEGILYLRLPSLCPNMYITNEVERYHHQIYLNLTLSVLLRYSFSSSSIRISVNSQSPKISSQEGISLGMDFVIDSSFVSPGSR